MSHHAVDDKSPAPAPLPKQLALTDADATEALGATLAPHLAEARQHCLVIWLCGDLGAGKTTFTRGLLRALGHNGSVKSPTYTLIEPYVVSRIHLHHFDFYRFDSPDEFLEAGLDEYFSTPGVCLVEWADKALPHVPAPDLEIHLAVAGAGRLATLLARSERGRTWLTAAP